MITPMACSYDLLVFARAAIFQKMKMNFALTHIVLILTDRKEEVERMEIGLVVVAVAQYTIELLLSKSDGSSEDEVEEIAFAAVALRIKATGDSMAGASVAK